MNSVAIRTNALSKRYNVNQSQARYDTLREMLMRRIRNSLRRSGPRAAAPTGHVSQLDFWALSEVTFQVGKGEVIGVIGRNGAGKSTLLKVLARITEPTRGTACIHGRVGSLLEVGSGFHNELTGRENIYLSGAIYGMKKAELDAQLDSIIDFAEISRFIDTPVKHYSSGMYMRLAFAVAAHLDCEVLLVDEVLAVGDLEFQRKCMGKMSEVGADGRTVLFVSHNLAAVQQLCHSVLLLQQGSVGFRGSVADGIAAYAHSTVADSTTTVGGQSGWVSTCVNGDQSGKVVAISPELPISIEGVLCATSSYDFGRLKCVVYNTAGDAVIHQQVDTPDLGLTRFDPGLHLVRVNLPPVYLAPGVYTAEFRLLGRRVGGTDDRCVSDRFVLHVEGNAQGMNAALAPPGTWSFTSQ